MRVLFRDEKCLAAVVMSPAPAGKRSTYFKCFFHEVFLLKLQGCVNQPDRHWHFCERTDGDGNEGGSHLKSGQQAVT